MKKENIVSKIAIIDGIYTVVILVICIGVPFIKSFIDMMGGAISTVFFAYLIFNIIMDVIYLLLTKVSKTGEVLKGVVVTSGMFKIVITVLCLLCGIIFAIS